MALLEKQLIVKKSRLKGAGKGLFTTKFIAKGTRIVEYKGKVTTWEEASSGRSFNGYIYYVNKNHVIDAKKTLNALARYANDARGFVLDVSVKKAFTVKLMPSSCGTNCNW